MEKKKEEEVVECKDGVCEVKREGNNTNPTEEENEKLDDEQKEDSDNDLDDFEESEEVLILKNTIENLNEKLKASHAELVNYRRRKDEEVNNRLKFANQDLILEILPILDNFERAIKLQKVDDANLSKFLDGFKMIYNSLNETLKKFGVVEIDCLGKEFDPNIHNAMLVESDKEKPNNTVLEVLIKGYMLKDKVIRPASVKVNKID